MYLIVHTPYFNWTVDYTWKKIFLKSIQLTIYNPVWISDEYKERGFISGFYTYNEKILFGTTGLIFKTSRKEATSNEHLDEIGQIIENFFMKLRYSSKQISITKDGFIIGLFEKIKIKKTANLKAEDVKIRPINKYTVVTGINKTNLLHADNLLIGKDKDKTFNDISLDAFESFRMRDYKKSTLYSAMAVEILLQHHYTDLHTKILHNKKRNLKFRIIQEPNDNKLKEPLIDYLLTASRNRFELLLHEIPLYLIGKTIRYDNPKLYENLKILHETRNLIVHHGKVYSEKPSKKLLSLDEPGSLEALKILNSLYKYFNNSYADDIFIDLK